MILLQLFQMFECKEILNNLITSYGQDLEYFFGNNGLLSYRSTKILKDIFKICTTLEGTDHNNYYTYICKCHVQYILRNHLLIDGM